MLITGWSYKNQLCRKLVINSKIHGWEEPFSELAEFFCRQEKIAKIFRILPRPLTISPIPCTDDTLLKRGFNQAETISRVIANHFDGKFLNILKKPKITREQKTLSKLERQNNARQAFAINGNLTIPNNYTVIVDDIITTGSTLKAAGEILFKNGVKNLIYLSILIN